jgi:hypothetical protein
MQSSNAQLEVLFFTRTSFAQKEFKTNNQANEESGAFGDVLEKAFWNGLLFEMLPELNDDGNKEENKFLWQLNNYNSSLWMNLSSEPHPVDPSLSVDPYQFLRIFISN